MAPGSPSHTHDFIDLTADKTVLSNPIDLTGSDDEDEDLKRAIALSLQDQQSTSISSSRESVSTQQAATTIQPARVDIESKNSRLSTTFTATSHHGLLGFDRKQMEEERLARLKRKRDVLGDDRMVSPPPLQRKLPIQSGRMPNRTALSPTLSSTKPSTPDLPGPHQVDQVHYPYPHGEVFFTSLDTSVNRSISLSAILKPTKTDVPLKSAFLSTFQVDFDWLLPHFNTPIVSFVLALHAYDDRHRQQLQKDFEGIPNVRLTFPYVGGNVNCMHSKTMLLFYESTSEVKKASRCRVVVPSANLVPYDWGVGAVMQNILFVIDLPPLNIEERSRTTHYSPFKNSMIRMLEAMSTPIDVIKKLDSFDFSDTKPYHFIHTIGGSHLLSPTRKQGNVKDYFSKPDNRSRSPSPSAVPVKSMRTGAVQLSDIVRGLGLALAKDDASYPARVDFITSSLGNLKAGFLRNLYLAICGRMPETPTAPSRPRKKAIHSKDIPKEDTEDLRLSELMKNMKVYFPSESTVRNSKGGPRSGGTICFQAKWWDGDDNEFPREMITDCVAIHHDRMLMHSKILFVRYAKPKTVQVTELPEHYHDRELVVEHNVNITRNAAPATKTYAGWVYLGSANLSESAWGSLVADNKTKQPKLNCRNWESGVLIPIPAKPEHFNLNLHELSLNDVFGHIVPIPIEYPGVGLLESGRRPWFFNG